MRPKYSFANTGATLTAALFTIVALVSLNTATAEEETRYKVEYRQSEEMPDHIALMLTANQVRNLSERNPRLASLKAIQASELEESQAERLLQRLIEMARALQAELDIESREMSCRDAKYQVSDSDAADLLDALDDVRASIYSKYLIKFTLGMSADELAGLDRWLLATKKSTSYFQANHKVSNGAGAASSIASYCAQ